MGKATAVLVTILLTWAALAQIWPDAFQLNRNSKLKQFLWGRNTIWFAVISVAGLLGWYIWHLEERLATLAPALTTTNPADETNLRFVAWGPLPDNSGCHAVIDTSSLPTTLRDNFDIALVCGFADPAIDRFKDTRISLSPLFTPQNALAISLPFSKVMSDSLLHDQELAIAKIQPQPPHGTPIGVANIIWMKAVLFPKGFDTTDIHKLADVPLHGKIASADASVQIARTIPAK